MNWWSLRFFLRTEKGSCVSHAGKCALSEAHPLNWDYPEDSMLSGPERKYSKRILALAWEHLVNHVSQESPYGGYFLGNVSLLCLPSYSELAGEEWAITESQTWGIDGAHTGTQSWKALFLWPLGCEMGGNWIARCDRYHYVITLMFQLCLGNKIIKTVSFTSLFANKKHKLKGPLVFPSGTSATLFQFGAEGAEQWVESQVGTLWGPWYNQRA